MSVCLSVCWLIGLIDYLTSQSTFEGVDCCVIIMDLFVSYPTIFNDLIQMGDGQQLLQEQGSEDTAL